jgi:hypothetical protein
LVRFHYLKSFRVYGRRRYSSAWNPCLSRTRAASLPGQTVFVPCHAIWKRFAHAPVRDKFVLYRMTIFCALHTILEEPQVWRVWLSRRRSRYFGTRYFPNSRVDPTILTRPIVNKITGVLFLASLSTKLPAMFFIIIMYSISICCLVLEYPNVGVHPSVRVSKSRKGRKKPRKCNATCGTGFWPLPIVERPVDPF